MNSALKREIGSSLNDTASDVDSMTGRRIGVFELKNEIGRGGMGTVYMAERADGGKTR